MFSVDIQIDPVVRIVIGLDNAPAADDSFGIAILHETRDVFVDRDKSMVTRVHRNEELSVAALSALNREERNSGADRRPAGGPGCFLRRERGGKRPKPEMEERVTVVSHFREILNCELRGRRETAGAGRRRQQRRRIPPRYALYNGRSFFTLNLIKLPPFRRSRGILPRL